MKPYSTVPLPDDIVIGGHWPHTIITWPEGKSRSATKPEHDLFQALEKEHAENAALREALAKMVSAYDEIISSDLPPVVKASFAASCDGEEARAALKPHSP